MMLTLLIYEEESTDTVLMASVACPPRMSFPKCISKDGERKLQAIALSCTQIIQDTQPSMLLYA